MVPFAEDAPLIRSMVLNVLQDRGYTVLEASNGQEALRIAEAHLDKQIDLLLTDVGMPQMGGVELAGKLTEIHPETEVLFTSGYTGGPIAPQGAVDSDIHFIAKPFMPKNLAQKVRQVLEQ